MKLLGAIVFGLAGLASGCVASSWDDRGYSDSEIVFGISQSKNADGKVTTSVGYEHLDVRSNGWNARGLVTRERSCWAERLDDRLGQPKVAGGVAVFRGGSLPAEGIAVVANRGDDLELAGPAWSSSREPLTFEAKGFAMPEITPAKVNVPSLDLAILAPVDAAADFAIGLDQEPEIAWDKGESTGPRESIVASIVAAPREGPPDARGAELRCFFDRQAGSGRFPRQLLQRFATLLGAGPGTAVKGKLRIATHRQLTIFANGGWTVYVVASVDQREQPFLLQR